MPRGLGTTQRLMLFRLTDHELRVAEAAQVRQLPYRSPDRWSLSELTYSTFRPQLIAEQRASHEAWQETLRLWKAGDEAAGKQVAEVVNIYNIVRKRAPIDLTDFEPKWPED